MILLLQRHIASVVVREPQGLEADYRISLVLLPPETGHYLHPLPLALIASLGSLPVDQLWPLKRHPEAASGRGLHSDVLAHVVRADDVSTLDFRRLDFRFFCRHFRLERIWLPELALILNFEGLFKLIRLFRILFLFAADSVCY